jgi:DNA-directed RNA polymerase subunit RPC12/RpoP
MNNIRFGCQKCGQRLACEPASLGTRIQCPACKQTILVPTLEIVRSYEVLELELRAPFDEVKQTHLERIKAWHPDRFTQEPDSGKKAADKTRELNRAFETITAYLGGTYVESRPRPVGRPETRPEPENKPAAPPEKRPEPKPAPAAARPAAASPRSSESRAPLALIVGGVTLAIALIAGLVWLALAILHKPGPVVLTDDSTGTQWLQAKEKDKRSYARSILVEMEQKGLLRQYGVRANDQFFYDGLEAVCRKQNPDDLNSKLVDLSVNLVRAPH